MSTYNDLLGEPVDVLHPTVKVFAVDDNEGLPIRYLSVQLTPGEGVLELPRGRQGVQGPQGEPAAPWYPQGDLTTTEINNLSLGVNERGFAYRNTTTNALHYWDGDSFIVFQNAFGQKGDVGPAGALAGVTIAMKASGTSPEANVSGPVGAQVLHIEIPEKPGPKGDTGPAASIASASDYDNTTAPATGDVVTRLASGKWAPGSSRNTRLYSLPEGGFEDTGFFDSGRKNVASFPLDVLSYASVVELSGHVRVEQNLTSQTLIEIRVGDPINGALVGKGITTGGAGARIVDLRNHYSSAGDTNRNTSPTSPASVIPANHTGNAGTLYITAYRLSGVGTVRVSPTDAQLLIKRIPA